MQLSFKKMICCNRLLQAVTSGHIECVKLLVTNGATVNKCDRWDANPLHHASIFGHQDIVSYLIDNGAKINTQDHMGDTSLHLASFSGHYDCVLLLLNAGADTNILNDNGHKAGYEVSPLVMNKIEAIRELIDNYDTMMIKTPEDF
jgi:ankyrin repeat protein